MWEFIGFETKGFSSFIAVGASTREIVREKRLLLLVPMALEIESNGRMGFETGNEGIRRGGAVSVAFEDMLQANGLAGGREIEPDDLARRAGRLEKIGSSALLPSDD